MTSMESDLVAAAARALLDLAPTSSSSLREGGSPPQPPPPPSWNYKYKAPMSTPSSSSSVFRSLAPDVYCSSTTTTARRRESIGEAPASPAAISYSSSSSSSVSVSEDHSMSLDGYASETTLLTSHSHVGSNTGQLVEYRAHPQEEQEHQEDTFAGTTILLAIEEQDKDSLSPLHCYMRKHCVEAFAATPQDLTIPRYGKSHSGRVRVGQVGIRCQHCKHRPARHRQERAVCFPSSLKNIYHSIETWQRRHSLVCRDLPTKIKMDMMELMKQNRKGAGGRRQYWEESARLLGMETTATGVRFVRTPGLLAGATTTTSQVQLNTSSPTETMHKSLSIVYPADKALVTNYLFTLMEQMEFTRFTEQDRIGGRSKVKDCPVGLAGMQCKHCRGKAGFGRYFPNTVQALASANSDRNIFNHIDKCRKCPESIRQNLKELHEAQSTEKNKRGQRKQFFERVWTRLHGAQPQKTWS